MGYLWWSKCLWQVVKMSEQKVRGVRGVRILAMSRIFPHGRDLGILIVTTP